MQLRHYFRILQRYWLIVLLLPLLAGGLSLALALRRAPGYQASARLMITRSLIDQAGAATMPDFNDNYSWTTTEFILDDLPQVITSAAFAGDVRDALAAQGFTIDPGRIQGGLRAAVLHRSVQLTAVADTPELSLAMVRGAVDVLRTNGLRYWGRTPPSGSGLDIVELDPPTGAARLGGPRDIAVEVGLRSILGLALGIGLALLLYYLDDRVRDPAQAEHCTGARVLAVIPKESTRGRLS